jgi:DNA replication ATP-dependent helicase Dna2
LLVQVISAEDYTLIQGLPGTGKTSTIAFVARLLAARGKRVLVTSYTHAAVDNLLLKLTESGVGIQRDEQHFSDVVRIGPKSACHPNIHTLLAPTIALEKEVQERTSRNDPKYHSDTNHDEPEHFNKPGVESLYKVISAAKIVGVSALTIPRSPLLIGQHFDVVIVDEAGQIAQPAILGALMAADSFVLVGDHMQLPPLVVNDAAEEAGKSEIR